MFKVSLSAGILIFDLLLIFAWALFFIVHILIGVAIIGSMFAIFYVVCGCNRAVQLVGDKISFRSKSLES